MEASIFKLLWCFGA